MIPITAKTAQQSPVVYSVSDQKPYNNTTPDGGKYVCFTDGMGTLSVVSVIGLGIAKPNNDLIAPDGSVYVTITDGNGNIFT